MARARNLKPAFFLNEELGLCPFEARLLFQGLWCLADREGKLEDRPLRIKAELFPYDVVDVDALLSTLASHGLIIRYEAKGMKVVKVVNFVKHQKPHQNETESELPDEQGFEKKELATKVPSTCDQGSKHLALPSSSLLLKDTSLVRDEVKEKKGMGYKILLLLSDKGLEAARKAADGWDIYKLGEIYQNNFHEPPDYPDRAFPAWCAKYTKGAKPA